MDKHVAYKNARKKQLTGYGKNIIIEKQYKVNTKNV